MPPRRLPKTLTTDEVAALLAQPNPRYPTGARNYAILTLMYRTGLRSGEVVGLHLRDWRRRDSEMELRAEVAKGGREATVYLDAQATAALSTWVDIHRPRGRRVRHLFTTMKGGPIETRYMREMVARYAAKAGIEKRVSPHVLRHTFATDLLREPDMTIRDVQEAMRHADIRTTSIYLEVFNADLKRKILARGVHHDQRKIHARSGTTSATSK